MKKKPAFVRPPMQWRIGLLPRMVRPGRSLVKVFNSITAFNGYVHTLRELGIRVVFSSPFDAQCMK